MENNEMFARLATLKHKMVGVLLYKEYAPKDNVTDDYKVAKDFVGSLIKISRMTCGFGYAYENLSFNANRDFTVRPTEKPFGRHFTDTDFVTESDKVPNQYYLNLRVISKGETVFFLNGKPTDFNDLIAKGVFTEVKHREGYVPKPNNGFIAPKFGNILELNQA